MKPTQEIYTALDVAYTHFNQHLFDGQLPNCLIVLQRQSRMMGYVSHQRWINENKDFTDELAINPEYFLGRPLIEVMQTLVHEQCHIWQQYFGSPSRRSYHNKEWAEKMENIGLMPSSTGKPGGRRTGQKMSDYVIYGGRFQESFFNLKDQGFTLPWLDRRGSTPTNAAIYNKEGVPALKSLPPHEAAMLYERLGSVQTLSLSDASDNTHTGIPTGNGAHMRLAKRPTRTKYRCCDCGNQAWGKQGMALVCGNCQVSFVETD